MSQRSVTCLTLVTTALVCVSCDLLRLSTDQTEREDPPVVITGTNVINSKNGRIRCQYETLKSDEFKLTCQAMIVDALGNEAPADAIEKGYWLNWSAPDTLDGEPAQIQNPSACPASDNELSETCDVRLVSITAVTLRITLVVTDTNTKAASPLTFDITLPGDPTTPLPSNHIVFVSSKIFNGNLGGLSGADAKCTSLALAAGLGGRAAWRAILSDSTVGARDRILIRGPVRNTRFETVSLSTGLFNKTGALAKPIQYSETGASPPDNTNNVWTGSELDGSSDDDHCSDWKLIYGIGETGSSSSSNKLWLDASDHDCLQEKHLYCISQ